MGIAISGIEFRLPKLLAWCLAGVTTLAWSVSLARADILPTSNDRSWVSETFDQEPATQPGSGPTTRPSPGGGPFLPAPSPAREERIGDVTRTDQGEIVPLEETQRGPLTFSLTALFMYGGATGYAQTPKGHNPSSTTPNRPNFGSIGIDDTHIGDIELGIGWQNQQIFLGGQYNHLSGNGVLSRSVVSDGVTFPARTSVHSEIRSDWYRLGYRYSFVLDTAPNSVPDFTLTPWLDGFYWDYGYSLDAGRIGHASKSLQKYGFQLGGTIAWRPNGGPLSLEANLAGFPHSSRLANISTESLLARYHFYHWRHFDFNVLLGVEWQQQFFDDRQRGANNRIIANLGPMLLTGLQVNF